MDNERKIYADYKEDEKAYEPIGPGQSGRIKPPRAPGKGCAPAMITILAAVLLIGGGLAAYLLQVQKPGGQAQPMTTPTPNAAPASTTPTPTPAPTEPPVDLTGNLDNGSLYRVIRAHTAQVRSCYEKGLAEKPGLSGQVRVRFLIDESGKVNSCIVTKTTLGNKTAETCICDRIATWVFPPPEEEAFSASYTFSFSPPM